MAVILASQSPRRRELLERMGISDFLIRPAQGEEIFDPSLTPAQLVEALSRQKAEEISAGAGTEDIVIAADTVVSVDGRVLGKMGHTERYTTGQFANVPGEKKQPIFDGAVSYFKD